MTKAKIICAVVILFLSCSSQDKNKIVFDFSEKGEYIYPCLSLTQDAYFLPNSFTHRKEDSIYTEASGFNFDTIKYFIHPENKKDTLFMTERIGSNYEVDFTTEPNLSNSYLGKDVYRLLWGGAFRPIVIITLTKECKDIFITNYFFKRQRDEEGRPIHQTIDSIQSIKLDIEEWNNFEKLVQETDFWNLFPKDMQDNYPDDGSSWLIEGHKQKQYRYINRISPGKDNPIRICGEYLAKLAKLDTKRIY